MLQATANLVRVDMNSNGLETRVFAATFTESQPKNVFTKSLGATPPAPLYMRLARLGDNWTVDTSGDGTTWTSSGSFTFNRVVTQIGLFAGNVQAQPLPPNIRP